MVVRRVDTAVIRTNTDVVVSDKERYLGGVVPLMIGVTGHRDLCPEEVPQIRAVVRRFFLELFEQFPDRPLRLLTPLAEGADQLVAEIALELNIHIVAAIPMERDLYLLDFDTEQKREQFLELYERAEEVFELPPVRGVTKEEIRVRGRERNAQYAQLGVFLCAHSHILLALWDGKTSEELGGTAQVVRFHHYDVMTGYSNAEMNQQILADDDSDLVFQIVVSRNRSNGAPRSDLKPLSSFWLTTDIENPVTRELPDMYRRIFEYTSVFNRDVIAHCDEILEESYPLFERESAGELPRSVRRINRLFCAADWLAIYYQRRLVLALKISHCFAFLMAALFIWYADVESRQLFMVLFAVCFALAFLVNRTAAKGRWHSKYLEYRALAEGLRVQFYWAIAGVTSGSVTKYAHDNFLQKQDIDLGWIRNVMRVAGIGCDVVPHRDPQGLAYVIREWIGGESSGGQLKYYRTKASQYIARHHRFAQINKVTGFTVVSLLISAAVAPSESFRSVVFVVLGMLLLAVSVREAYAFRIAEKEVIKQYEFMYRIFSNAQQRINAATDDVERRRVLRVLGESALDEHAEWILLHRERPVDADSLWRIEV